MQRPLDGFGGRRITLVGHCVVKVEITPVLV
jgi:hypothetical protein